MVCRRGADHISQQMSNAGGVPVDNFCFDNSDDNRKEYTIPTTRMASLERKLKRIARAAKRQGLTPPEMEVLRERIIEVTVNPITGIKKPVRHYDVRVTGESPEINGWQFVGKVEEDEVAGRIVKSYDNLPQEFFGREMACEHCNTNRHRTQTFYLYNQEEDRYMQVGSGCLQEFSGAMNPHVAAEIAQFLAELEAGEWYDDQFYAQSQGNSEYRPTLNYLAWVVWAVEQEGKYRSRSGNTGFGTRPTADYALDAWEEYERGDRREKEKIGNPTDRHKKEAEEILLYVRQQIEKKEENGQPLSEYEWNLLQLATPGEVEGDKHYMHVKYSGYVASMYSFFHRERERKRVEEAARQTTSYWTETTKNGKKIPVQFGKRYRLPTATLVSKKPFGERFNPWSPQPHLYTFEAKGEDGQIYTFCWRSSSTSSEMVIGGQYQFDARIENHSEFRGVKQTWFSRPTKIEEVLLELAPGEERKLTKQFEAVYGNSSVASILRYDGWDKEDLRKEIWSMRSEGNKSLQVSDEELKQIADDMWRFVLSVPTPSKEEAEAIRATL